MADEAETPKMYAPAFKWEWNPNTLAILAVGAGSLVGWGYVISGWNGNSAQIAKLEERLSKLDDVIQTADRLDFRVTVNEANDKARDDRMDRFADVITSFRGSLAEIITEIRVVSSKQDSLTDTLKDRNREFRQQSLPPNRP